MADGSDEARSWFQTLLLTAGIFVGGMLLVTVILVGAALTGAYDDATLVDDTAYSADSYQLDLDDGEEIRIQIEVLERAQYHEEVSIEIETVADGTVAEWRFDPSDVEREFTYEADREARHTVRVDGVGEAAVLIERVEGDDD